MEITKITKEEALKDLSTTLKEGDFLEKTELPKEIAVLVFAAYKKGVDEYQMKYWGGQSARAKAEKKFTRLALRIAESFMGDEHPENETSPIY